LLCDASGVLFFTSNPMLPTSRLKATISIRTQEKVLDDWRSRDDIGVFSLFYSVLKRFPYLG
jgi:hypothetical protein